MSSGSIRRRTRAQRNSIDNHSQRIGHRAFARVSFRQPMSILPAMVVGLFALLLAAGSGALSATESTVAAEAPFATASPTDRPTERMRVPALTPVYVKIDEEISSKRNKTGERFRIVVAEDVVLADRVVIPAGAAGEGEIIHAARSGVGGKPGELLLAARFVKVGDIDVPLRSMVVGVAGRNRVNESVAVAVVVPVLAFAVVGGAVIVPRETLASAKTAREIELPAQTAMPVSPPVTPADATKGGVTNEKNAN